MDDPCLQILARTPLPQPEETLQFWVRFTGITKVTPRDRIARAIAEELVDLAERTLTELTAALAATPQPCAIEPALETLRRALDAATLTEGEGSRAYFPRAELEPWVAAAQAQGALDLAARLTEAIDRHRRFEQRVGWLLHGTRDDELAGLDPIEDADRIYHHLSNAFRVEARVLELLAINRIAVSTDIAVLIRGTRESEERGVARFYDTYALFANYFEWGRDSKRGRDAAARINAVHGRYTIPNEDMKFVLLQTAFTWLDGADRLGHRHLLPVERHGLFHALVRLGRDMHIEGLEDDYDVMLAWFRDYNRAHAAFHASKRACFDAIVHRSIPPETPPQLALALELAARAGMDDDYRSALGCLPPSPAELRALRAVFFTLGQLNRLVDSGPYLRSLQNNPARRGEPRPERLGPTERSRAMPVIDPALPNGGFPLAQLPVVERSQAATPELPILGWDEVRRHCTAHDLWVVIDGDVYDLSPWAVHHPGGLPILMQYAGRDATEAFTGARHSESTRIFALNFRIARVR